MVQNIVDSGTKPISKMRWSGGLEFRENRKERENRRGRVGGGDCRKTRGDSKGWLGEGGTWVDNGYVECNWRGKDTRKCEQRENGR